MLKYAKRVIADLVELEPEPELALHTYPKYPAPVVVHEHGRPVMRLLRWGVWPSFARDKAQYVTNARDDRLLASATWRRSVAARRCLIPVSGYFEPGAGPAGARGEVLFTLHEQPCFFIAGVWDTDPDGSGTRGHAMVTIAPNAYVAPFQDRMPAVLSDAAALAWLGSTPLEPAQLTHLLRAPAPALMRHEEIPPARKPPPPAPEAPSDQLSLF